jgi:hypothetical protein
MILSRRDGADLSVVLFGQIVVDIAHSPIYIAAADTQRPRSARQTGRQAVNLVGQVRKTSGTADILGRPVAHKNFNLGLSAHGMFLF